MKVPLTDLSKDIRIILLSYLIVMTIGVSVGLVYLANTSEWKASGIQEHYQGSPTDSLDEFDIPEKYPKTLNALLLTTHNHVIIFSIIFFILGMIFSMNTLITGRLKLFLLVEPFVSIILTFGGIWGLRFVHDFFLYVIILSAIVMYFCFYFMVAVCIYQLINHEISSDK